MLETKELFKQKILDFHKLPLRSIKERELSLPTNLDKIIVITGMRRVGKTSLLLKVIEKLRSNIPIENILYINFEDERLKPSPETLDTLLQAYRELYPKLDLSKCYFFFDEIQEVDNWEKFVRRLEETISKHIFITGSNSKLLSTDIATSLRGRSISYELFPLSFKEFLNFKNIEIDTISSQGKAQVIAAFHIYMTQGGFPEIALINDTSIHTKIIQEYYDVMIFRDIIERYQESNLPALRYFLKRLIESVGSPISINKIHRETKSMGLRVSINTLHEYFEMSEAIYLITNASKFDPSLVRQNMAEKKSYLIDNSFLQHLTFRYSQDTGKFLENLIAIHLRKLNPHLHFIKTNYECDFILEDKNKLTPIQVSVDISHPDTLAREVRGLVAGANFLKVDAGTLITLDQESNFNKDGIDINVVPAWKFLLNN